MLYTIAAILFALWLLGYLAFSVGSTVIHLLLVLAVAVALYKLIMGRRAL